MNYTHRPARRSIKAPARRALASRSRRTLIAERLEERAMLTAADWGVSDFWNPARPQDVNADTYVTPLDALIVINELNRTGARAVMGPGAAAEGETTSSGGTTSYFDVNNDGFVTPLDALIVVNTLNAEGEHEEPPQVRYKIHTLVPDGDWFQQTDALSSVSVGDEFDLVVTIQDLRPGGLGAFAGYLDVLHDTSKAEVVPSEFQDVIITGGPTGGSFRLSFNGQQTANINYSPNLNVTATRIETALNNLFASIPAGQLGAGGRVQVRAADLDRWEVRFNGLLRGDVPELAGHASGTGFGLTGGTNPSVNVVTTHQGVPTDPFAFVESFRSVVIPGIIDPPIPFGNGLQVGDFADRFDDLGTFGTAISSDGPFPLTVETELVRTRMRATSGGTLTFTPDVVNVVRPQGDTLLISRTDQPNEDNPVVPVHDIIVVGATLNISADITANADTANTNEDTAVTINVVQNDTTTLPGTLQVRSVDTSGISGSVTIVGGTSVQYTPALNFVGEETFFYTVGIGASGGPTAIGSVTVTVDPVNDAPVNSVPGAQNGTEDIPFVFSTANSNAITVSDVDAASNPIQVTLSVTNGTVTLGSTANLTVTGNGTANITITGAIADINAGLNGLTMTPAQDFAGAAQLTITSNDQGNAGAGGALSDQDTVTINFAGVNDAPVNSVPGAQQVDEGTTLPFTGASAISVSDVDAGVATIRVTLSVTGGTGALNVTPAGGVTVSGNGSESVTLEGSQTAINAVLGSLVYTPAALFAGSTTLVVTTDDLGNTGTGGPQTDIDNVAIEVIAVVRPRAVNDTFGVSPTIPEGSTNVALDVMDNDLPTPGAETTLLSFTQPTVGTVTRDDNGTPADLTDDQLVYNPGDADFFGTVTFTYTINDTAGTGDDSTATVSVTLTNVNDPPVAVNDSYSTPEDTTLIISAPGVLGNDTDVDNNYGGPLDVLTAVLVSGPANGSLTLNADGSFSYTPSQDFFGDDTFTYRARDAALAESNVATVTITVTPVNDAPVAVDDSYNATEDQVLLVDAAAGVLDNDTDVDSTALTAELVGQASNGVVALNPDGSFSYTPNGDFFGIDTFTYQVRDDQNAVSNTATVTINVANVNDAPVATNDSYNAVENTTLTITAPGVLGNDTDIDSATLTAVLVSGVQPSEGTLTLNANGSFTFVPATEFNGLVTFTYQASDGSLLSNTATVTINVQEVNDPPTSVNDSYQTDEDVTLTVPAPGVLGNDTDPENDTLTAVLVSGIQPSQGTLTLNANGSFTYAPAANFSGNVTFTYRASDGLSLVPANVATVTITVNEVNDPPTAVNDSVQVFKDTANNAVNVLANDSIAPDVGETIQVTAVIGTGSPGTSVTTAQGATVRLVSGQVFYDAPAGFVGSDSFQYQITDSRGGVATATVSVEVIDAIPSDVGGRVYIDANANGNVDLGERGLMGVTVRLTGVDIRGNAVNLTAVTDIGGFYVFAGVVPGQYQLTQVQPKYLKDGHDSLGGSHSVGNGNDSMVVTLPQTGIAGGAMGNNFAELGIDGSTLADARGLLGEVLASSGQNGFVLATTMSGNMIWTWSLPGWTNMKSAQITLDADLRNATLRVTDLAGSQHTIRIHQAPSDNTESNYPSGSMGRFRILGWSSTSEYIIRLDGTAADFGLNLLAAAPAPEAGEGEGPVQADREFAEAADAFFAEEAWA